MNRKIHVRFCESLGVKFSLATRLRGGRNFPHSIVNSLFINNLNFIRSNLSRIAFGYQATVCDFDSLSDCYVG